MYMKSTISCLVSQVWILAEHVDGAKGVICRREGITPQNPAGTAWDKGAGVCTKFCHIGFPSDLKTILFEFSCLTIKSGPKSILLYL